jgi:hypothetical protein
MRIFLILSLCKFYNKDCQNDTRILIHLTILMMNNYILKNLKHAGLVLMLLLGSITQAQIFEPEGLMMPGQWNGWTNYPASGSALRTNGIGGQPGGIVLITNGIRRYQTTIHAAASGGDVVGGSYNWLFTSGPAGTPYANKWCEVNVTMNTLQNYVRNGGPDNSIIVTNGRWYTMNWRDNGYNNTQAIFMETSAAPVNITSVVQSPLAANVTPSDPVVVTINTSNAPSPEERFYVRYTTNNYTTSTLVQFSMVGSTGTATIPALPNGSNVSYYVLSSTLTAAGIGVDYDMCTIHLNNNANSNYNYTSTAVPPVDVTFQVNMNAVSGVGTVNIAGTFNGFSPAPMTHLGGGIYSITLPLAQGSTHEYKFLNNTTFEGNLSAPCGIGTNRTITVPTNNITVPVACFSSCDNCVDITFQVNMSNETVGGLVNLAGSFNGWSFEPMTGPVAGVYSRTRTLSPGTLIEYKFVNGSTFEGNLNAPCGNGSNRTLTVPGSNQSLPVVCFNSCNNCTPQRAITFQVNMSNETVSGGVFLAGSFNGFSTSANPMTNIGGGIYSTTINLPEGQGITYKFVNGSAFENNLGAPCGNGLDRTFTVPTSDATIPVVCFGSCTNCAALQAITFSVDMSNETVGSGVFLAGSFNGFSNTANPMLNMGGGIYSATLNLPAGSNILYKFVNGSAFESGNSGCGVDDGFGGFNRTYTVPTNAASIPTVCFNQCGACAASNVWTSVASGNWNNPAIWNQASVPAGGAEIVIAGGHTVSLNVSANINSVIVQNNATLNLAENLNISNGGTVNGVLRIQSNRTLGVTGGTLNATGAGRVQLDNNASLLHGNGTPGGGGAVTGNFRAIRQGFSGQGYSFMSAPMQNVNLATLGTGRYWFNPQLGTIDDADDANDPGWVTAAGNMVTARGYAILNPGNAVMNGVNPNEGTLNIVVNRPPAPNHYINLIGNPFPSAISALSFINNNGPLGTGAIGGTIYFWDNPSSVGGYTSNDYAYWNTFGGVAGGGGNVPNGQIASGQGFFVEALIDNQTVSFFNNWRGGSNNQFFSVNEQSKIRLSITNNSNHYNELLIGFKEDATEGFDQLYDARKMIGNPDLAFYSKIDNEILAINALPVLEQRRIVELGLRSSNSGVHTVKLAELENMNPSVTIFLIDRETGVRHNLRLNDEYAFTPGSMNLDDRFAIEFGAPISSTSTDATCEAFGQLTIETSDFSNVSYQLLTTEGFEVRSGMLNAEVTQIENIAPYNYILKLIWEDGYSTEDYLFIAGVQPLLANNNDMPDVVYLEQGDLFSISNYVSGAMSHQWLLNDMLISEMPVLNFTATEAGVYILRFSASNMQCELNHEITIHVRAIETTTSINNIKDAALLVYPNPARENIMIRSAALQGKNVMIKVYDTMMRSLIVQEERNMGELTTLSVNDLKSGIYILTIQDGNDVITSKFVINK